jgi:hypothetical protein
MSFKVGGHSFAGRYALYETDEIKDWPGLYAILCRRGNRHYLIDIGESDNVKSAVKNNGRKELWYQSCSGTLVVTVYYALDMQQSERVQIERKIRRRHNPPCRRR